VSVYAGDLGKFLAILTYVACAVAFIRVTAHVALWFKRPPQISGAPVDGKFPVCRLFAAAAVEALTLRRLFRANPVLWVGEWAFHMSFVFVLIRHLRYFLTPVPGFVWQMQLPGRIAGYIMPLSLFYIFIVKAILGRGRYTFSYNYFLLAILFFISGSGVLMTTVFHPNIVAVKEFTISALRLKTGAQGAPSWGFPDGLPFLAHFILVLVLLVYLPTHIFAAPFTEYEAKKRERALRRFLHD